MGVLRLKDLKAQDLREIQTLLSKLGYYPATEIDGIFGQKTAAGWRKFKEANYLGDPEAIGERSWELLRQKAKDKAAEASFLRLTRTNRHDEHGLVILLLEYVKAGERQGVVECVSGVPSRQNFRKGTDSKAGSLEPLPEGRWTIGDIQWADGSDNYSGRSFGSALGPVKVPLGYSSPEGTQRSAILIHLDWNAERSPGTAGCLAPRTVGGMKRIIEWLRDTDPKYLYVDYALGTGN